WGHAPARRGFHQRPPQEPQRAQRADEPRMPQLRGALRDRAGRFPHHRDRPALRHRLGPRRDQHGAQRGLRGHQPRPGRGRPEDRAVQTRRRDPDHARPSRGRASPPRRRRAVRPEAERRPRFAPGLPPQREAPALPPRPPRHLRQPLPLRMNFLSGALLAFFGLLIGLPIFLGILKYLCWFTTVNECRCKVFVLFGKVIGVISEPGVHVTPFAIGPSVLLVPFFGKVHTLDLRLDQRYLRSRAVNSEEGTPVGIGVWYEMRVSDPVAYLFENTDPEGSLQANVTNTTVRSLSNMPLDSMM